MAPIPALYVVGEGLVAPVLKRLREILQELKVKELPYLVMITWSLELEWDAVNEEVRSGV